MTGDRCHRRRSMLCRGSDGSVEIPCPKSPDKEEQPDSGPILGLDFYAQAKKALSDRSPFEPGDDQVSTVATLPSELANLVARNLDRKRQRKLHQEASKKARGSAFWAETEEYFRDFVFDDVEQLEKLRSLRFLGSDNRLLMPMVGDGVLGGAECSFANEDVGVTEKGKEVGSDQLAGIDSVERGDKFFTKERNGLSCSGVEWLLGCKEKVYITSERPSKKRKLFRGDAGLEKVLVSRPVRGSTALCDYCSLGDIGDRLNQLILCRSCNMAVHQSCYGVHEDINGSWLCHSCKSSDLVENHMRPCVLCPKMGGALKPTSRNGTGSDNGGYMEFAHLFCCQWIPEVYIHDTITMEPVMNIEGINGTRMKLVCNICKVKGGACVRCSNGTCRTSFHPICAREAGHKMEIWGKFGSDDVELRAYCSKHFGDHNSTNPQQLEQPSLASCSDSHDIKHQIVTPVLKKPHILKIGERNGDKVNQEPTDPEKPGNNLLVDEELADTRSNSRLQSKCDKAQQPVSTLDTLDSLDYTVILNKLIDGGEVNLKDVASEIGVSPDSLASISSDNHLVSDLHSKVTTRLRNNAHIDALQKKMKTGIKSSLDSKDDKGTVKDSNSSLVVCSDVSVSSESPHRRTKSNIKILKGKKVKFSLGKETDDGLVMSEAKKDDAITKDADNLQEECLSAPTEKLFLELDGINGKLSNNPSKWEEGDRERGSNLLERNTVPDSLPEKSTCLTSKTEPTSTFYIQPLIHENITKMQTSVLPIIATYEVNGSRDREVSPPEVSPPEVSPCLNELIEHLNSSDTISRFDGSKLEQLANARNFDFLRTSAEDEVQGELLYHQQRLLRNAVRTKHIADNIIAGVVKSLPQDIDITRKRKWDDVIVNQYMSEIKAAKHRGRKERRHREAQAVLSAATAAAAASSRISSLRNDTVNESVGQENLMKVNTSTGMSGPYSQQMPRAKETVVEVPCGSSEMISGLVQQMPVEGIESVVKGSDCHICHRKKGVCIKCNYGLCRSMFHPSCARSAGLYMNLKSSGSKLQHKAYCEKHYLEQRAKAETQRHDIEELNCAKQIRVELERLRLLCERIIKREKLKRELVLCSQDILVSNRDTAALSALVRSPFFPTYTSSESAMTTLRENTDDCRSGSEAIQRSDDVTVDSIVPNNHCIKFLLSKDNDRKTDDSSTSHLSMPKPRERVSFAGKQIPDKPLLASENLSYVGGEKKSKSRKV